MLIDDTLLGEYYSYVDSLNQCGATTRDIKSLARRYTRFIAERGMKAGPDSVDKFIAHRDKHLEKRSRKTSKAYRPVRNMNSTYQLKKFLNFLVSREVIPPFEDILPKTFQDALDSFFSMMIEEGSLVRDTCLERRNIVKRFLFFVDREGPRELSQIDTTIVYDFFRTHYRRCAPDTAGKVVGALKPFFRLLHRKRILKRDISESLITPRKYKLAKLPKVMNEKELDKLLASLAGNRPMDVRDRAMILLLLVYGLRLVELSSLTLDCFDWENNRLIVKKRKQRDVLELPLLPSVGVAVAEYIRTARPPDASTSKVFCSTMSVRPIASPDAIGKILEKRFAACGVNATPGSFRHTLASHMVNRGASYEEISAVLGHASVESAHYYAKVNLVSLREVAENYSLFF